MPESPQLVRWLQRAWLLFGGLFVRLLAKESSEAFDLVKSVNRGMILICKLGLVLRTVINQASCNMKPR